jgi:hypothetical protein
MHDTHTTHRKEGRHTLGELEDVFLAINHGDARSIHFADVALWWSGRRARERLRDMLVVVVALFECSYRPEPAIVGEGG